MSTKPYDQAFKYLAQQDAETLLVLVGDLEPGQAAEIKLLPNEVSIAAQLPDQCYEVTTAGRRRLVHLEAQTVYDPNLPERMLEYAVRLWLKYRLPITSYALLLTDRKAPKDLPASASLTADNLHIALSYVVSCLWEMSAAGALALNRQSLLPFVPLMQRGVEELETSARRLGEITDRSRQEELSLHFLLVGGLRYNRDDLLELIGRQSMIPLEQFKDSSFYQLILEEGVAKGIREGEASLLRRQLAQRFGELPEWARQRIDAADSATLGEWGLRFLDASSLEEVIGNSSD